MRSYTDWEQEVIKLVGEDQEIPFSDAAGIVEGQPFCLQQAWGKGLEPQQAADNILAQSCSPVCSTEVPSEVVDDELNCDSYPSFN